MSPIKSLWFLALAAIALTLMACEDTSSVKDPLDVPTEYPSADYTANVVDQTALRTGLQNLNAEMQKGRSGEILNGAQLSILYSEIQSATTSYYDDQVENWLVEIVKASEGDTYDPMKSPQENGEGGVYGPYLYDEYGIETQQEVEKGLFAAMSYYQAHQIASKSSLTPADIDGIVELFGASPAFPNSDKASENADVHAAKYAARRDKNDGNGFYTRFASSAKTARAAAAAGSEYNEELRSAVNDMMLQWELSQYATVVNYLYATLSGLSQTSVSDADRSSAMHAFGEALGFLHGWKQVPVSTRILSDSDIDELLRILKYFTQSGNPEVYEFWQDPVRTLPELQVAMDKIQVDCGFTDQQMIDFRENWVNLQGR